MKAPNALVILALGAAAGPALAQSIVNPSYENGPAMTGGWTRIGLRSTVLDGWTVDRGNIDYVGTMWQADDGARSIDLNGDTHGRIYQTLNTTPGMEYVVDFALSGNWGGVANKTVRVTAASYTALYTVNTSGNNGLNMNWVDRTFSFVAANPTTTIRFASQNRGKWGTAIDDIKITAIPAPASSLALLGVAGLRRRRR